MLWPGIRRCQWIDFTAKEHGPSYYGHALCLKINEFIFILRIVLDKFLKGIICCYCCVIAVIFLHLPQFNFFSLIRHQSQINEKSLRGESKSSITLLNLYI